MSSYQRPPIVAPVFHDADGHVIDHGRRWPDAPPDETYSTATHPERFAPLHTVAAALLQHLADSYDVHITAGTEIAEDLLFPVSVVQRAVRIEPRDPGCASLTIVWTPYPGILVHAGLLTDFRHPVCGCDACDESWESEADRLEEQVLAVVSGHFGERIRPGLRPRVEYSLTFPDGSETGGSNVRDLPPARVDAAGPVLRTVSEGWAAWPRTV